MPTTSPRLMAARSASVPVPRWAMVPTATTTANAAEMAMSTASGCRAVQLLPLGGVIAG
jgi:hypothetical protein